MVKQYTESQYDDDLTLGNDDYDDSYYSDADDLFELSTDNESPISRLKSLVLSIDWEITDDVLRQFNEELVDLKSIWAGEAINLVYVQALEKISKYIYQKKADAHPSAIKLLLTFYYNLEKIVSSVDLSEGQKRDILLEDVKRFENFKRQIKVHPTPDSPEPVAEPAPAPSRKTGKVQGDEGELLNLKAIVLGIDWEITEQDLNDLRREVFRLEDKYSHSRPKLILLQGIGTLAAYIKVKKSNAHPDAFKVLQHFYECLERIVLRPMTLEEEKAVLFPAVEKFNAFKSLIGPTIAPEVISQAIDTDEDEDEEISGGASLAPALADVEEDSEMGFQAEREAMALGLKDPSLVTSHIDHFFGEAVAAPAARDEAEEKIEEELAPAVELFADEEAVAVDKDVALQGVDVGEEDEEVDADDVLEASSLSPVAGIGGALQEPIAALADIGDLNEEDKEEEILAKDIEEEVLGAAESILPEIDESAPIVANASAPLDRETALLGVNVETEADDDSDELSLPMEGEELAPALAAIEEESLFSAKSLEAAPLSHGVAEELSGTIDSLFLDEEGTAPAEAANAFPEETSTVQANAEEEAVLGLDWLDERPQEEAVEAETVEESAEPSAFFSEGDLAGDVPGTETRFEGRQAEETLVAGRDADEDLRFDDLSADDLSAVESQSVSLEASGDVLDEGLKAAEEEQAEEAVIAFFADEAASKDVALDESAIEDLFDSLESDSAEVKPVADSAREPDVDAFFANGSAEDSPGGEGLAPAAAAATTAAVLGAAALAGDALVPPAEEVIFELAEDELVQADQESAVLAGPDGDMAERLPLGAKESLAEDEGATDTTLAATEVDLADTFDEVGETAVPSALEEAEPIAAQILAEEDTLHADVLADAEPLPDEVLAEEDVAAEVQAVSPEMNARLEGGALAALSAGDRADSALHEEQPAFDSAWALPVLADPLDGLRACVDSLKLELNDKILNATFAEINGLRQRWIERPLEKTFLQLLSTVAQHIDSYRYEASAGAHGLLESIFQRLASLSGKSERTRQELLLGATLQTLEWQQGMLSRQAVRVGEQLTFVDPLRTEGTVAAASDAQKEFDALLEEFEKGEGPASMEGVQVDVDDDEEGDVAFLAEPEDGGDVVDREQRLTAGLVADDLKKEIAALRETLHHELAQLRRDLKNAR